MMSIGGSIAQSLASESDAALTPGDATSSPQAIIGDMSMRFSRRLALAAAAGQLAVAGSAAIADVRELMLSASPAMRLLVVAPHPDDEALGSAGLIQRVRSAGGQVRVVLVTSGDAFPEGLEAETHIANPRPRDYRSYGALRERETLAAMQRLGIDGERVRFLGFPDGGICLIASSYLSPNARAFVSPYTGREEPPAREQIIRGARYRGVDIRRELERILIEYRPTLVTLPHPEDLHPDHCSTYIFAREALDAAAALDRALAPRVLHYLVHTDGWPPDASAAADTALEPPPDFPPREGEWRTLKLSDAEAAGKRRALDAYASQALVMSRFLRAFGRTNELFLEGRPASLPECWCDATSVATEVPPERYRRRPRPRR
jgi:LmbE family N-acetylglucosaminyl deacetylase